MKYLSFDIETIPQEDLNPSQLKQYSKKEPLIESKGYTETMIKSTDPFLGRILCIGLYFKSGDSVTAHKALYEGSEKDILTEFWDILGKLDNTTKIISFNGFNFDIPWIRIRSLINELKIPSSVGRGYFFNVNPFKNTPHVDMMVAIKNDKFLQNITVNLGLACDSFGIPTPKDAIDGSQVYEYYKMGKIADIAEYVKKDVYSTGLLYEKMVNLGYI